MLFGGNIKSVLRATSMLMISVVVCGSISAEGRELKYGAFLQDRPNAQGIDDFENLEQRHLDVVNMFIDWNTSFSSIKSNFDAVYANGSIMSLTWEAWNISNADVTSGVKDDYIRTMARDMKAYNKNIIVRLFHEANGNWYPWALGDSKVNTNETYIAAFRHVVDIFRQEGVTNVKWDFNVNISNCGAGSSYMGHYPGDNYVDIISIDGYNWGITQTWSSWQSFDQLFSQAYEAVKVKNKPMSISEFSSAEQGGDKAKWYTDAFNSIKSDKYALIDTAVVFSINKETDWRINSSDASLKAYSAAINSSSNIVAGDVNDDNKINILDYTSLQRYIVNSTSININTKNADITGDSKINIADLLALRKILLNS